MNDLFDQQLRDRLKAEAPLSDPSTNFTKDIMATRCAQNGVCLFGTRELRNFNKLALVIKPLLLKMVKLVRGRTQNYGRFI